MDQEVEKIEESGIDIYLVVEAPPPDELLNKLSTSVIDPTTNIIYHPLTNLVPTSDKTWFLSKFYIVYAQSYY